jgi:YHS domain-containing protein/uncharacterized membrane protein
MPTNPPVTEMLPASKSRKNPDSLPRLRRCQFLLLMTAIVFVSATTTGAVFADTAELVQVMCPVMTDEKIDPDISLEYEGQTVYFCCQKCRIRFGYSPKRYTSAIILTTAKPAEQISHGSGSDHASSQVGVLNKLGRFHPIAIHFPIALLICAALARCLMLLGCATWAGPVVRFCVLIGGVSAVVAATLGWFNAGWPDGGESLGDVLFSHRWLGVGTATLSVILIALIEMEARKPTQPLSNLTTLALFIVAGLVGATGHFGGILVFGPDYLPW